MLSCYFPIPLAGLICKIKPMRIACLLGFLMFSTTAAADGVTVAKAYGAAFSDMPSLIVQPGIKDECGGNGAANSDVIYCTSNNTVFLRDGAANGAYLIAHVMGHAVQVRHGVADIALREIRARRDEEAKLRGWVTRQVECIAGFMLARAGMPLPDLDQAFDQEPFTGSHWGRNPIRIGPKVSIGTSERAKWLAKGHGAKSLEACAVGEFGAELLIAAYRG